MFVPHFLRKGNIITQLYSKILVFYEFTMICGHKYEQYFSQNSMFHVTQKVPGDFHQHDAFLFKFDFNSNSIACKRITRLFPVLQYESGSTQ